MSEARNLDLELQVQGVMTPFPHSVGIDQQLTVAKELMQKHGVRHLPVQKGGQLVGIVSDRDINFSLAYEGGEKEELRIEDVCTLDPYVVTPQTPVRQVARRMAKDGLGCVLIVDREKLVGIFTTVDACRTLAEVLNDGEVISGATQMFVEQLMQSDLHTVSNDGTVLDALELMTKYGIRHVPIVEADKLVGMVSERDVLMFCEPNGGGEMEVSNPRARLDVPVAEIMSPFPACVKTTDDVVAAIEKIISLNVGALPVLSETDELVGILSYVDILQESLKYFTS